MPVPLFNLITYCCNCYFDNKPLGVGSRDASFYFGVCVYQFLISKGNKVCAYNANGDITLTLLTNEAEIAFVAKFGRASVVTHRATRSLLPDARESALCLGLTPVFPTRKDSFAFCLPYHEDVF